MTDVTPVSVVDVTPPGEPVVAPVSDADGVRAGAQDLGDITGLDGPSFPRNSLDGDGDRVDYHRFTLTAAKTVGLGLRRQDADADLFLEDADGNVLHSSAAAGTAKEWISATLLAGTYYARVEAQEAGENAHVFRYGVSEADQDEVARLEAARVGAQPEAPAFDKQAYAFDLAENADGSGTRLSLGTGSATDPEGETVSYRISGGNEAELFEIDASTGELFYTGSGEDYESDTTSHALTVRTTDGTLTADTAVTVTVTDVAEAPETQQQMVEESVSEPAGEDFTANTDTVGRVLVGESVTGDIATAGDTDWFAVELEAGRTYRFDLAGEGGFDAFLRGIYDNEGSYIDGTTDDDGGEGLNARVEFTATGSGVHYVSARGQAATGTYELAVTDVTVEPGTPDTSEPEALPPLLLVGDEDVHEADGAAMRFLVTLFAGPEDGTVTVDYATEDGTAVAGEDYTSTSGTLTFTPGETQKWVAVPVIDDTVEDSGETFTLVLSNPTGGAIVGDATGVGTILNAELPDDFWFDASPLLSIITGQMPTATVHVGGDPKKIRSLNGVLDGTDDVDWYSVALTEGETWRFLITAKSSNVDPAIWGVYRADGTEAHRLTSPYGGYLKGRDNPDFGPQTTGEWGQYYLDTYETSGIGAVIDLAGLPFWQQAIAVGQAAAEVTFTAPATATYYFAVVTDAADWNGNGIVEPFEGAGGAYLFSGSEMEL